MQVTKVKFTWSPSAEPVASSPPEEVGSPHLRGDGPHPRREAKVAFTSHSLVALAFSQHAFPKERPASGDRFQLGQTYNTASLRLRATLPREMAGPPSVVALTQLGVPIPSAPKPCASWGFPMDPDTKSYSRALLERAENVAQSAESMPSRHEALGFDPQCCLNLGQGAHL